MPNHIRNVWRLKRIPKDKMDYVVNKLTKQFTGEGLEGDPDSIMRIIDFDLIIPEPRFKKDCPKECIVNKDSHVQEYEGREWFNWYNWHLAYWGTKWGAYDGYTKIGATQLTMVFNTAWSFAEPIANQIIQLCEQIGCDAEFKFADEDYGSNCGTMTYSYKDDDITKEKGDTKFARYIWDNY